MSDPQTITELVLDSLKKNYFSLALTERRGETPAVTEKLDNLESAIRDLETKQQQDTK